MDAWREKAPQFVPSAVFLAPSNQSGRRKYDFTCLDEIGDHTFIRDYTPDDAQRIRAAAYRYRQLNPTFFLKVETLPDGIAIWRISGVNNAIN